MAIGMQANLPYKMESILCYVLYEGSSSELADRRCQMGIPARQWKSDIEIENQFKAWELKKSIEIMELFNQPGGEFQE